MFAILAGTLAQGASRTVTVTQDNKKRVIEVVDTVIDGKAVTDTLSITTYEGTEESDSETAEEHNVKRHREDWNLDDLDLGSNIKEVIVAVTAIVFVFGMPTFLVLIIVYFRHKNRKAKYHLAEQALANGTPLPDDFFKSMETSDSRTKGIKNIFLGIGLFIFLWAITGEFGIGSIGLLVMFTGFGQLVIYYTQQPNNGKPFIHIEKDQPNGQSHIRVGGIEISNQEKTDEEAK